MRILLLTQWFAPEPIFKGLTFAKALQKLGHEVQVLTGFPNYPEGKLFEGYKLRLLQREIIDGVPILRLPLFPSHSRSTLGRVANYISFALAAACLGTLFTRRADVVYVYHPPATVGLPALCLRFFRRLPFVYDIQDLWPESLAATGMIRNAWLLGLVNVLCCWIYRAAAKVVVPTPGFKEQLASRGVPAEKIEVVFNWCDEQQFASVSSPNVTLDSHAFNIVFAGNMGPAQGLESVLSCAEVLQLSHPEVRFVLVGDGIEVERLKTMALGRQLRNVQFVPRQPPDKIGAVIADADALLVHLRSDPLFEITIPSKTQAYLAAGRPLIMAVRGDAADLVRRAQAGVTCEPENPSSMSAAIVTLLNLSPFERRKMGTNGQRFYFEQLSVASGARKFESIFLQCNSRSRKEA